MTRYISLRSCTQVRIGRDGQTPIDLPTRGVHSKTIWSAKDVRSYPAMPLHVKVPEFYRQVKLAASSMLPEPV